MSPLLNTLLEIQKTNAFDLLNPYKDPSSWTSLKDQERHLLAELILKQGAQFLAKGSNEVLRCFELSAELSNHSALIYFQQGLLFGKYADNPSCLKMACRAYSCALEKNPNFVEVMIEFATALLQLGYAYEETDYFLEAIRKLERALELTSEEDHGEIYWRLGFGWFSLGKLGGEPSDFQSAVNFFRRAVHSGEMDHIDFWNDYGNAVIEVASIQDSPQLYEEAWNAFVRVENIDPTHPIVYYSQGYCLFHIAKMKRSEECYLEAISKFDRALQGMSNDARVWWMFANAELGLARLKDDLDKAEDALEKFERAHSLDPEKGVILAFWAEAELFLGSTQGEIELIQSAKQKILRVIELEPERSDIWYLYGTCLNEMGHYFEDTGYYEEAIKKFEYGLTLTDSNPMLWYGIALSHFAIGDYNDDPTQIRESIDCFAKASESDTIYSNQFSNDWGVALMKWGEMSEQVEYIFTAIKLLEEIAKQTTKETFLKEIEWIFNYTYGLYLLAQFTEDKGYLEQSINLVTQIIEVEPNFFKARYTLALALGDLAEHEADLELYEKAIDHFKYILAIDPEYDSACIDCAIAMISLALLKIDLHLSQDIIELYQQAEQLFLQAIMSGSKEAFYHMAGLYSLLGKNEAVLHYLEKSLRSGDLPPKDHLMNDGWLEGFRETPYFEQFITNLP